MAPCRRASRRRSLRRPPPVRARPSEASTRRRAGARGRAGGRLGQRDAPQPGRVGDHQAADRDGDGQDGQGRAEQWRGHAPIGRADRELEGVQVGRQHALVGVHDGRRQRQGRDVRVHHDQPGDHGQHRPDHEPAGIAGRPGPAPPGRPGAGRPRWRWARRARPTGSARACPAARRWPRSRGPHRCSRSARCAPRRVGAATVLAGQAPGSPARARPPRRPRPPAGPAPGRSRRGRG